MWTPLSILALLLLLLPDAVCSYNLFGYAKDDNPGQPNRPVVEERRSVKEEHDWRGHIDDSVAAHRLPRRSEEEQTLSSGLFHTCAITYRAGVVESCGEHPCGPVKCWGHDEYGQASPPPGVVFDQLSSGGFFTCGLKGGKTVCWGDIDHPPKSLESLSNQEQDDFKHARRMQQQAEGWRGASSRPLIGESYFDQLSSGLKHACAISRDREVHCWGRNDYGESSPPGGAFVQISAGHSFTCGMRPNGKVECWGKNDAGQSTPPSYPQNIFRQISASVGGDHACGIVDDGSIVCWGNNGRGQSEKQEGTYIQLSAGMRTTCAIREDSDDDSDSMATAIHCWGSRANTLLDHFEDGSRVEKWSNGSYHHRISLGQDHACATAKVADDSSDSIKTSLECWWMAGSDVDAHRVPVGLEMVA